MSPSSSLARLARRILDPFGFAEPLAPLDLQASDFPCMARERT